jgi:hypothetical protein
MVEPGLDVVGITFLERWRQIKIKDSGARVL